MRRWIWIGLSLLTVVALAVGGGTALASRNTSLTPLPETGQQWGAYLDNATLTRVATALGLTPAELGNLLQSGKTLAQLAQDKGVAAEKVSEAILAPHRDELQLRVKYGYITQEQADGFLATARQKAGAILNQTFAPPGGTSTPGASGSTMDDMIQACNSIMGSAGMGGMMGGQGGGMMGSGMMGGQSGGMMGSGMMGGWGTPRSGAGSWWRGMMGRW